MPVRVVLKDIAFAYNAGEPLERLALKSVSLTLSAGVPNVLLGPNGCGKTTLVRILAGELKPTAGSIAIEGVNGTLTADSDWLRAQAERVYQDPSQGLFPDLTLCENLALRLPERCRHYFDPYRASARFLHSEAEIAEYVHFYPAARHRRLSTLSGGERQIFSIGIARLRGAALVLLDEPTAALDVASTERIERMLTTWLADPTIVSLLVTHNSELARRIAFQCIDMVAINSPVPTK